VTLDQLKLGMVETPVAPLDGEDRLGAGNSEVAVLKFRIVE